LRTIKFHVLCSTVKNTLQWKPLYIITENVNKQYITNPTKNAVKFLLLENLGCVIALFT